MSLDADTIVDRRRMRRKLTFWRVLAIVIAIAALVAIAAALHLPGTGFLAGAGTPAIARVSISGLIRTDQDRVEALARLEKSRAPAVIVQLNTPGGTTSGSEQLYDSLMRLKEHKPVVIVVDGLAASGGYITAIAGDHIIAQETSLVGSIGVIFQYPNVGDLLEKLGIKVEEIKSSPLKAAPNGFEPTSPEARAAIASIVSDSYAWFRNLVKTRRNLDDADLERGVSLKLVDELGDERTALDWLSKEKKIDPSTPVRDYRLRDRLSDLPFLHTAAVAALDTIGLRSFDHRR